MRLHIIACRVLQREFSAALAHTPNMIDVSYLPQGLHNTPDELRRLLQEEIDRIFEHYEKGRVSYLPDAIVLGYGLCSNAVLGLTGRSLPLIIPRTDDCMALFLGSQQRYLEYFSSHSGTYWLNNGWIEASRIPTRQMMEERYEEMVEKYGEDNADFLLEQEMLWTQNYKACGFIDSPLFHNEAYIDVAKAFAADFGWSFFRVDGDSRLIDRICHGQFDDKDFLTCPPHHTVIAAYDGSKMATQAADTAANTEKAAE